MLEDFLVEPSIEMHFGVRRSINRTQWPFNPRNIY